jgi:tRNA modification GTPase
MGRDIEIREALTETQQHRGIRQEEPICGIATHLGEGGITIIRVSGLGILPLIDRIFQGKRGSRSLDQVKSHRLLYGWVFSLEGEKLDEVLLLIMRSPNSYTREDVVEIHCHGGLVAGQRILRHLFTLGIRLADPGEFTKRAFLNGRIDLAQAEAVMELIQAKSELSYQAALRQLEGGLSEQVNKLKSLLLDLLARVEASIDFSEEDIDFITPDILAHEVVSIRRELEGLIGSAQDGLLLREGVKTVIAGRANAGKSSLFNRLLRSDRAIVTPLPGTTRDLLEERVIVGGVLLRIIDTAGFRGSTDPTEREGIQRGQAALENADLALLVLDGSEPLLPEDHYLLQQTAMRRRILVINKVDRGNLGLGGWEPSGSASRSKVVKVSATTGEGIEALHEAVKDEILRGLTLQSESPLLTTVRQREVMQRARVSLDHLLRSIQEGLSWEFLALDLRDALDALGEITGATVTEDILQQIFRDFCIGK